MKASLIDLGNKELKKLELPNQFNEKVRSDLVKRAVESIQAGNRQPYGVKEGAGMRASADLSRRRKNYRGAYGHGISRVPRKILSRRGSQMFWVGAVAPGTVGGRRAHPPKAEKIWDKKINKKENRKAIRSAIAASALKDLVSERGHILPENYPLVIENKLEDLDKTKKVKDVLKKIGLTNELERVKEKKIRSGKGKRRGRKYKQKKGPLIVVAKECSLMKSARNIPGITISPVNVINAELLAPGSKVGRLVVWTEGAIERLRKEKLFD